MILLIKYDNFCSNWPPPKNMHNEDSGQVITHFLLKGDIYSLDYKARPPHKVSISAQSECDVNVKWVRLQVIWSNLPCGAAYRKINQ